MAPEFPVMTLFHFGDGIRCPILRRILRRRWVSVSRDWRLSRDENLRDMKPLAGTLRTIAAGTFEDLIRRDAKHRPISVKALARGLPKHAWRMIEWREGTAERLSSRFARVRVRVAHRDYWLAEPRSQEWLLIEWPQGEDEPRIPGTPK